MSELKIGKNQITTITLGDIEFKMNQSLKTTVLTIKGAGRGTGLINIEKEELGDIISVLEEAHNDLFIPKDGTVKLCDKCKVSEV